MSLAFHYLACFVDLFQSTLAVPVFLSNSDNFDNLLFVYDLLEALNSMKIVHIFAWSLVVKNLPARAGDARDVGLIPRLGKSPGKRHGNPLRYSCLENAMNRGAWWATVHRIARLKQLSTLTL